MILRFFFWKELKKFPFFFFLLGITLLLGTLGLTGISIISGQVRGQLENNAKNLLTSDLVISARREFFPDELEKISTLLKNSKRTYQVVDFYSMVTHLESKQARLVELRAIEEGFPFYGQITLRSGTPFNSQHFIISKDLADLWSIKEGDELQVGVIKLKVQGIVKEDSSVGLRGFSLAPRVYLPLSELIRSGLMKPGATGSFARHYLLEDSSQENVLRLKREIFGLITDPAIKVTLPEDTSEQTGRMISMISSFMSLAALIGLILSLVGIFYLYQSHLVARLKDLCLINLFGLTKEKIILGILGQFTLIFAVVFMIDLLILIPGYKAIIPVLSQNLGLDLSERLNLMQAIKELPFLYGLALSILIPLVMGLMRTPMGLQLKASKLSLGKFRFYDFIPFLVLLWSFSWRLSHSQKIGSIFFASLMGVFLLSTVLISLLQWFLKKGIGQRGLLNPSIEIGLALRSLTRSGHKLTLSFLSLAMGATLISLILQLDGMIQKEFEWDAQKPGLFVFDIQEEQMESLKDFALKRGTPLDAMTPMIRARLEKVNGKKFERKKSTFDMRAKEEDEDARLRNNGINITYRDYLTSAEKIVKGNPFPKAHTPNPDLALVSLEKRWSERMGLNIGDKVTFDIQGVEQEGIIHNLREVKWTTFYPNFFVTLEPGVIEGAPKTYLAVLPAGYREQKLSFQRESINLFPNISFIDVEELVGKLSSLFEKSRYAIEIISWLSLAVGFVILYGLSHDQVYRRYYDLALMKSLGFSANQLRLNLLLEFGTLFLLAMFTGFFLGWGIAVIIGKEIFKVSVSIEWSRMIYPGFALSLLCLLTILVSSWRTVRAKPRELLSDS